MTSGDINDEKELIDKVAVLNILNEYWDEGYSIAYVYDKLKMVFNNE